MRLSFKFKITLILILVIFIAGLSLIYLTYFLNVNNFLTESEKVMIAAGFFILLVTSLSAALIYLTVSKFLKPLLDLQKMIDKVSKGNLADKIKINSKDEIGQLGQALNDMIDNIRASRIETDQRLEAQNRQIMAQQQNNHSRDTLGVLEKLEEDKKRMFNIASDLQKFKLAADHAYNHIVITNPSGIIIYANKSVERITGFTPEEVVGKKVGSGKLWGGHMDDGFYENMWNTIAEKKEVFTGEIQNRRKNGEYYIAEITISPILGADGELSYFLGIERDITKEKEVDQAKTEFLSLASHQLRTPLTNISWYTEMLLKGEAGKLNKQQQDFLHEIYKGNRKMIELVNAFLNVSRLEMGTFMVNARENSLIDITKSVIHELNNQFEQKKIVLKKDFDENLPKMMLDENLTRIIIQNLLTNALKYSSDGSTVKVRIKKSGKNIEFVVADEGIGIPASQQAKIFTKLYRAENAIASEYQGSGLGLYIVKSILSKVGGQVEFESKENEGSVFKITLPLTGMKSQEGTKVLTTKL